MDSKQSTWFSSFFHKSAKPTFQWTDKLASLADQNMPLPGSGKNDSINQSADESQLPTHPSQTVDVSLRLEGPYFTGANPSRYKTVICFVAGTGVSGAIAIALAFLEQKRQQMTASEDPRDEPANTSIWERCVVFWSVKAEDYINLPYIKGRSNLHFHYSSLP